MSGCTIFFVLFVTCVVTLVSGHSVYIFFLHGGVSCQPAWTGHVFMHYTIIKKKQQQSII